MDQPGILWTAVSPGVMELPTTKFRITYRCDHGSYTLTWDGGGGLAFGDLQSAKDGVFKWMADLIEMGIEV